MVLPIAVSEKSILYITDFALRAYTGHTNWNVLTDTPVDAVWQPNVMRRRGINDFCKPLFAFYSSLNALQKDLEQLRFVVYEFNANEDLEAARYRGLYRYKHTNCGVQLRMWGMREWRGPQGALTILGLHKPAAIKGKPLRYKILPLGKGGKGNVYVTISPTREIRFYTIDELSVLLQSGYYLTNAYISGRGLYAEASQYAHLCYENGQSSCAYGDYYTDYMQSKRGKTSAALFDDKYDCNPTVIIDEAALKNKGFFSSERLASMHTLIITESVRNHTVKLKDPMSFSYSVLNTVLGWENLNKITSRLFEHCTYLTTYEYVSDAPLCIAEGAFSSSGLRRVKIQSKGTVSLRGTSIFGKCSRLKKVELDFNCGLIVCGQHIIDYIRHAMPKITVADYELHGLPQYTFKDCFELEYVMLPHGTEFIADACFANCDNLTQLDNFAAVLALGEHAFEGCINLTSLSTVNLRYIAEKAFSQAGIAEARLKGCHIAPHAFIQAATERIVAEAMMLEVCSFANMPKLKQVLLLNTDIISQECFAENKALTHVHAPKATAMPSAFSECTALTRLTCAQVQNGALRNCNAKLLATYYLLGYKD